jgi:hypothetical protein
MIPETLVLGPVHITQEEAHRCMGYFERCMKRVEENNYQIEVDGKATIRASSEANEAEKRKH